MRKSWNIICLAFISLIIFSCSNKETHLGVQIKKLEYPSASGIEYYDGKLYIMGDDATNLLVLDSSLNIVDSISIIDYPGKRIPKDIKPDIEAAALNSDDLFLFGSGSLLPHRNYGWKLNLNEVERYSYNLDLEPLYSKVKGLGIEQINMEGACFVQGKLILVNRGNKGYPANQLIITNENFWVKDSSFQVSFIPFVAQKDTSSFKGISGLCYAKQTDQLIMTVSTENTRNSYDDGEIGKSYLWIINNISTKLNSQTIAPDKIIDLEEIDQRFKGYKIESVTTIGETNKLIDLVLVADNDDGSSTIFKMSIKKD